MISNIARTARMIAAAAVMATGLCASAGASTLSFTFSFTNLGEGIGTVTGLVSGLQDNATSLRITSNTAGFGIGEYIGNPRSNSWTVSSGSISSFSFFAFGARNTAPDVTVSSISLFMVDTLFGATLTNDPSSVRNFGSSKITFTKVVDTAAVPLPAGGMLLIGALAGLAALRRRKIAA